MKTQIISMKRLKKKNLLQEMMTKALKIKMTIMEMMEKTTKMKTAAWKMMVVMQRMTILQSVMIPKSRKRTKTHSLLMKNREVPIEKCVWEISVPRATPQVPQATPPRFIVPARRQGLRSTPS